MRSGQVCKKRLDGTFEAVIYDIIQTATRAYVFSDQRVTKEAQTADEEAEIGGPRPAKRPSNPFFASSA